MSYPAEQMLLSSVLRNGDLNVALQHGVNESLFHIYKSEYVWIEKYYLQHSRTPSKDAFRRKFPDFAIKVIDETPHWAEETKREHRLREIDDSVNKIMELAMQGDDEAAHNLMFSSAMKISSQLGLVVDGDIFTDNKDILADLAARKERYDLTGSSGIPTGFPTFDERTGGFGPGELHLVAANTGVGKSFSMQKMAEWAAFSGYKVQYNALEQPRANVMARIISLLSPRIGGKLFSAQNLMRGKDYDPIEFYQFMNRLQEEIKGRLHVADGSLGKVTPATVAAQIERNQPDIVFVDHITLMGARTNDWQGIGEVADELTFMCNRYDLPIVAGAQLNRSGKQDGSGPESIGDAYKIAQNASGMTMIRPKSRRVMFYEQVKYRNGGGGWGWWVRFDPDNGKFDEISHEIAKELIMEDEQEAKNGPEHG